jgi:IS30 family transposase
MRQYLPRAADLSRYIQAQLDAIASRLNTRPRLTLDLASGELLDFGRRQPQPQ